MVALPPQPKRPKGHNKLHYCIAMFVSKGLNVEGLTEVKLVDILNIGYVGKSTSRAEADAMNDRVYRLRRTLTEPIEFKMFCLFCDTYIGMHKWLESHGIPDEICQITMEQLHESVVGLL